MNNDTYNLYLGKYTQALENKIYTKTKGLKMYIDFMDKFSNMMYNQIHLTLDPSSKTNMEYEREIRRICIEIETKFYPTYINIYNLYFKELILETDTEYGYYKNKFIEVEDRLYSLMALRNLKHFAFYIERGKRNKLWEKTMDIFESYFWYCQRMIMKEDIEQIRSSFFPGAGKTYAGNLTCAFWFGYDNEMSILRITYSEDLAKQFTRQIVEIIETDEYKKVFPKFNRESKDLWSVNNAGGFKFSFSTIHNFYATTTGGQATGKRAKLLMIDDVSKGQEDAYNIDVHNSIVDKFDSNWASRTDEDKQYQIIMGTMWSPYDLLNVIYQREKKKTAIYESSRYKYTEVNNSDEKRVTKVFISVPILDYKTDESTCPKRYSTAKMREKRNDYRDKDLFEAVYQQRPVEPEALIFAWSRLNVYDKIPFKNDVPYEVAGMIDPPKVGKNFLAFGIFKRWKKADNSWSKWYFIDGIYKLDTTENQYGEIVKKIIHHRVSRLGGELNTNSSLLYVIKEKCVQAGYTELKTKEVWSYENKEMKISGARNGIKNDIVFPSQKLYSLRSEIGQGMAHLTTWNISGKNAYDDFPDMVAMFVINFCAEQQNNTMEILDRKTFSF